MSNLESNRGDARAGSLAALVRRCLWRGLFVGALVLTACSGPGRMPDVDRDGPPKRPRDVSQIPDAVPRVEPITAAGNKSPYTVFGRTYQVMPLSAAAGYREKGVASWYGTKFHGRTTSNGEIYDLYGMTAAHRSLPIPSYVRVTNLDNQRTVIVRVNDRGPFHGDRIIDLSWAAAQRLGFADQGVARVEVVAIDPREYQGSTVAQPSVDDSPTARPRPVPTAQAPLGALPANTFLQVGAFSSRQAAEDWQRKLSRSTGQSGEVRRVRRDGADMFRVLLGPLDDHDQLASLTQQVVNTGQARPFVVYD